MAWIGAVRIVPLHMRNGLRLPRQMRLDDHRGPRQRELQGGQENAEEAERSEVVGHDREV